MSASKLPAIPQLLQRKIYKTGQTRGADDDSIYQNRVSRNSTVLIPFPEFERNREFNSKEYENGYIVLISPSEYFETPDFEDIMAEQGLTLGTNAVLFYQLRSDWYAYPPTAKRWTHATSRKPPLGGQFVARIAATTALEDGSRINLGFTTTSSKGAGIRVYEYADSGTIANCRIQLEALFWLCADSIEVASSHGMSVENAKLRKESVLHSAESKGLLEYERLISGRVVSPDMTTICPLCLFELSSQGFLERMAQAEGRVVHDLTITEINLFHIEELQYGTLNHRPYNLGWGHHHCNVVVRDAGINVTVEWMREVLQRNDAYDLVTHSKRDT